MIYSSQTIKTLTSQANALMKEQEQITETAKSSSTSPSKIQKLEQRYLVIADQLSSIAEQYEEEMLKIAAKTNSTVSNLLEKKENLQTKKERVNSSIDALVSKLSTPHQGLRLVQEMVSNTPNLRRSYPDYQISLTLRELRESLTEIDKELHAIDRQLKDALAEADETGNTSITDAYNKNDLFLETELLEILKPNQEFEDE